MKHEFDKLKEMFDRMDAAHQNAVISFIDALEAGATEEEAYRALTAQLARD